MPNKGWSAKVSPFCFTLICIPEDYQEMETLAFVAVRIDSRLK